MWQRFSNSAKKAVLEAQQVTQAAGGSLVGIPEVLLGILAVHDSASDDAMSRAGVNLERLKTLLESKVRAETSPGSGKLMFTEEGKWLIDQAYRLASVTESVMIEPLHLFWAIASDPKSQVKEVLQEAGFDPSRLEMPMIKRGRRFFNLFG